MLKSISFKKLAVLSAGIAIVLSSCGLQNSASESSGTETAAGKTKNFALTAGGVCWDNAEQWNQLQQAFWSEWRVGMPKDLGWDRANSIHTSTIDPDFAARMTEAGMQFMPTNDPNWFADLGNGVPCPAGVSPGELNGNAPVKSAKACYTQEFIDATVAGFTEQRDKPDASEAFKAEMQRGIDAIKGSCVQS
jgi:hypothetical protein